MSIGWAGLGVGILVLVAAFVLIFATGGIGIPIGVILILGLLGAGVLQSRRTAPSGSPEHSEPSRARPGNPLRNEDNTAFVGTGEASDPLAHDRA